MRRPTDCQGCAYAGEGSLGDDSLFCFRRHCHMPAQGRCDGGLPLKTTSQRIQRRSGRWHRK